MPSLATPAAGQCLTCPSAICIYCHKRINKRTVTRDAGLTTGHAVALIYWVHQRTGLETCADDQ